MSSQLLVLDNRDDRTVVATLLGRLPPRERIGFLAWACRQVPQTAKGHLPVPQVRGFDAVCDLAYRCDRADEKLTRLVFLDLFQLMNVWGLDALATAAALERRVRARK